MMEQLEDWQLATVAAFLLGGERILGLKLIRIFLNCGLQEAKAIEQEVRASQVQPLDIADAWTFMHAFDELNRAKLKLRVEFAKLKGRATDDSTL